MVVYYTIYVNLKNNKKRGQKRSKTGVSSDEDIPKLWNIYEEKPTGERLEYNLYI